MHQNSKRPVSHYLAEETLHRAELRFRAVFEQPLLAVRIYGPDGRLEHVLTNLAEKHSLLQREQEKSERLLLNILPKAVAEQLKQQPGVIAERFEEVTVLFADGQLREEYRFEERGPIMVKGKGKIETYGLLEKKGDCEEMGAKMLQSPDHF